LNYSWFWFSGLILKPKITFLSENYQDIINKTHLSEQNKFIHLLPVRQAITGASLKDEKST